MEFGRIPNQELSTIDCSLPKDPLGNKKVIRGKPVKHPKIYLGCAKWGIPEWLGKLYPMKTKEKHFLDQYVQHFNSIELNATHYKIYGPAGIAKWSMKAGAMDFKFCPKMYKAITHRGNLKNKGFLTTEFLRGITAFGPHLGPVFIQVSDRFGPKRKEELFSYLQSLPTDLQFFVEVRHPEWFLNPGFRQELFSALQTMRMGAVITDTMGRRECCHMTLTIPKAFIRFVGNGLHPTDFARCDDWINRIGLWLDKGLKELYFFMHMHDEANSPELTAYLVERLNKQYDLKLKPPLLNYNPDQAASHR
jgi:uncharacterized protein YecE (DUF72 family)